MFVDFLIYPFSTQFFLVLGREIMIDWKPTQLAQGSFQLLWGAIDKASLTFKGRPYVNSRNSAQLERIFRDAQERVNRWVRCPEPSRVLEYYRLNQIKAGIRVVAPRARSLYLSMDLASKNFTQLIRR